MGAINVNGFMKPCQYEGALLEIFSDKIESLPQEYTVFQIHFNASLLSLIIIELSNSVSMLFLTVCQGCF